MVSGMRLHRQTFKPFQYQVLQMDFQKLEIFRIQASYLQKINSDLNLTPYFLYRSMCGHGVGLEWFIQKMAARCNLCLTFALGRYSDQMCSFRAASGWLSFHKLTDFSKVVFWKIFI